MTGGRRRIALVPVLAGLLALLSPLGGAADGERPERASRAAGDLAIGVVPQRDELGVRQARMIRAAGVDSVRLWLPWSGVELERDTLNWSAIDRVVALTAREGLDLLPFLFGSPEWAAERDGHDCTGFACIPYPPASIETRYAFARFAARAVERYGPQGAFWAANPELPFRPITAWQVWNEQNSESFYRPDADVGAYAALLKTTAGAIRAADPEAQVILGGMFGKRSTSRLIDARRYLRDLYRVPGIESSFDGVAVHPYDSRAGGALASVRAARAVIRRNRDDAGLWVTEIGWASKGRRGHNLVKSEPVQAALLRRTFTALLRHAGRWNLRGAYWYAWRDTRRGKAICEWCPGAGLTSVKGRAKPSYYALKRVARRR